MKNSTIFFLIAVAGIVAAWYVRGYVDEKEFEQRLLTAAHSRDTITQEIYTARKKDSLQIKNLQKVTQKHFKAADSIFQIGFSKGYNSAVQVFASKTAPEDTTIIFNTQDTLHHTYTPLTGLAVYDYKPFPSKQIVTTIIDTVFVPVPEQCETPWYNQWYVRVGELGLAILTYVVVK